MGDVLYLTDKTFKEFLDAIPTLKTRKMSHKDIRLMFEVLLYGAVRISEVLQLRPANIIGGGKIKLEYTKGGWQNCHCSVWNSRPKRLISVDSKCDKCHGMGKYRVPQIAWLDNEDVYHDLEIRAIECKPDKLLFPITRTRAWQYANELSVRTHTFRHSFLTWLLESDRMNIRDIKQKARHKNISTTDRYIENNPDLTQQKAKGLFQRIQPNSDTQSLF